MLYHLFIGTSCEIYLVNITFANGNITCGDSWPYAFVHVQVLCVFDDSEIPPILHKEIFDFVLGFAF